MPLCVSQGKRQGRQRLATTGGNGHGKQSRRLVGCTQGRVENFLPDRCHVRVGAIAGFVADVPKHALKPGCGFEWRRVGFRGQVLAPAVENRGILPVRIHQATEQKSHQQIEPKYIISSLPGRNHLIQLRALLPGNVPNAVGDLAPAGPLNEFPQVDEIGQTTMMTSNGKGNIQPVTPVGGSRGPRLLVTSSLALATLSSDQLLELGTILPQVMEQSRPESSTVKRLLFPLLFLCILRCRRTCLPSHLFGKVGYRTEMFRQGLPPIGGWQRLVRWRMGIEVTYHKDLSLPETLAGL
jgi:hypothetical protein